jgi:hypothetical protein
LTDKSRNITLADFAKLEWPDPPKEPICPLDVLEETMLKALDEVEDMKGKLIAQDKEMGQMKAEQPKVPEEEQRPRLGKAAEDRQGKVNSSLNAKELALRAGMSGKVDEGAEAFDPSGLEGEVTEQPVQSEQKKGLKQNTSSSTHFSAPPLHVSSLVGVPMYQHSAQSYGHQPVLRSSPYFCKCMCVFAITMPVVKSKMLRQIVFLYTST